MTELEIQKDIEALIALEKQVDSFLVAFNEKWNVEGISATLILNHKNDVRIEHKLCTSDTKQTVNGSIFKRYYSESKQ